MIPRELGLTARRALATARRLTANALWLLSALPDTVAFILAARDPARAQRWVLREIIRANEATEFGVRHGFGAVHSVGAFRRRAPLSSYEDYQPAIERIGQGAPNVLTAEPVTCLEPTSGSTTGSKLIPYTRSLQRQFQRSIAPWAARTLLRYPSLLAASSYWSISPAAARNHSPGGIPIGFEDDSTYLGLIGDWLAEGAFAVPKAVREIPDIEAFRYVTLLFLLRSESLGYISIWHPTFLTLLLRPLAGSRERLCADLAAGTISAPLPADLKWRLERRLHPDPARAAAVQRAFARGGTLGEALQAIWPWLRLVSCWADGSAAAYVEELRELLPHAAVQPKGLLSTEAVVSFPFGDRRGGVLALRSHFFEFMPVLPDGVDSGSPLFAHQLRRGETYAVAVTTGGGLYRYQLFDLVTVTGSFGRCPLVRFAGRSNAVVDHFGEKLNEQHVRSVLETALGGLPAPVFHLLALDPTGEASGYVWYVEAPDLPDELLQQTAATIEAGLTGNFHYRCCRELGQLGPLRAYRITGGGLAAYIEALRERGSRLGDIKPALLDRGSDWSARFSGGFVAAGRAIR